MNPAGADSPLARQDLLVAARSALLDALEALNDHHDSVIVIGAQAIYLRTTAAPVALAEATRDSDLAIDPRFLSEDPRIEAAMATARFYRNPTSNQPGAWMNPVGVPVDLMVPEALAGPGGAGSRGARIPPHDRHAMRRAAGLEAALIDSSKLDITSLDPQDSRTAHVRVAGPAALLIAKLHKIGERAHANPDRLIDKDAHDIYRILIDTPTENLASSIARLSADEVSAHASAVAIEYLRNLFADSSDAVGSAMAGRAEEGIGDPDQVSQSVFYLAKDLIDALDGEASSPEA